MIFKKKKYFENRALARTLNRWKYREILSYVDRFTALRFTEIGAPPAAGRMRILPMTQYACWPVTFGVK